tara:strand:+ start:404 stop:634 length:231 start_codon:yes stop_codon:yes gene_type:complete
LQDLVAKGVKSEGIQPESMGDAKPIEGKGVEGRLSDLKRKADSIRRSLDQASLVRVAREVEQQEKAIEGVASELIG